MKTRLTKPSAPTLSLALATGVLGCLALAPVAQAQTTNTIEDFQSFSLSAKFASWITGTTQSVPTGFEVIATGYGSGAYNFPSPVSVPGATMVQLTFTLNTPTPVVFMGPTFDLSDGTHQVQYPQYDFYSGPGTYVLTAPVGTLDVNNITAFNIEMDPAAYGSAAPYDITYNNLSLIVPPPPGGTYPGNGNSGFGGPIGLGSLKLSDDGTTVSGTINKGPNGFNDVLVLYVDSVPGGFADTSGFADSADGLRKAISGFDGANRSLLTFSGMLPDYAIALGPSSDNFGGLWQLANGGDNSLNFVSSVNLNPTGNNNSPTYTFSFNLSQIGLTPGSGGSFKLLGTYIANSGYRSDEAVAGNVTGTQGWNPFLQTAVATYTTKTITTVTVDPSAPWVGFMNVFNLPSAGGAYQFGSGWGTRDLVAYFTCPVLTLAPNTINDADPYWYTPSGGPGTVGNKIMDANMYVEPPAGTFAGRTLTFTGTVLANSLTNADANGNRWTSVAFIKDFAPDYSSLITVTAPLIPGPFSISLATSNDPGRHVQYGFETVGPDVWITDVAPFGSIQIEANPPCSLTIDCPANIVVANDPGQCSAVVNYVVSASGTCGVESLTTDIPSGSVFPKGASTVTATAIDAACHTNTCSFTVTVEDREAPVVAAQPAPNPSGKKIPVSGKNPSSGQNPDGYYRILARDNCDPNPLLYVHDLGSSFIAGPFHSGDILKLRQNPGGTPRSDPGTPPITADIHLKGDGLAIAVDTDGNVTTTANGDYMYLPPNSK